MSVDLQVKTLDFSEDEAYLRSLLGGALVADWRMALIARGLGWHVSVGESTTPIVGGGNGTVFDAEQSELSISIPSGYAMIPLRIAVEVQIGLQTTDSHENEIIIVADRAAVSTASGSTGTVETPMNMRTDLATTCPLTCVSANTSDHGTPTVSAELARRQALTDLQGIAANMMVTVFDLVYEPLHPPVFIGPAAVYTYFCGSIAPSGFIQASFLAIPSTLLTALR